MYLLKLIALAISVFFASTVFAQSNIEKFVVPGNCGMCKNNIEAAAQVKGVQLAQWNKTTDTLTVYFKPNKTSLETIQQSIAEAGYDTPLFKADDPTYNALPQCCSYRDETLEKH